MYDKVEQVFTDAMPQRFNAIEARNQKATYLFEITKEGSSVAWSVLIDDGNLEVREGGLEDPNCVLKMEEQDYLDMVNGRESIQMLYMTGKLKVEGDLPYAVKLARFFPAPEKK